MRHGAAIFFVSIALAGCGQGKLTRSQAAELIVRQQPPEPIAITLRFNDVVWNEYNASNLAQLRDVVTSQFFPMKNELAKRTKVLAVFKDLGFIEYRPFTGDDIRFRGNWGGDSEIQFLREAATLVFPLGIARLTAAGTQEAAAQKWKCLSYQNGPSNATFEDHTECVVPLTSGVKTDVTGITEGNPVGLRVATAIYHQELVLNRIGERLVNDIESFPELKKLGSGFDGQAQFQLYDDGWRLVR